MRLCDMTQAQFNEWQRQHFAKMTALGDLPGLSWEDCLKAATFRVPVTDMHPGRFFITSLDIGSLMPTDDELRQIASYIEFSVRSPLFGFSLEPLLNAPLIGGIPPHNTAILRKGAIWKKAPGANKDPFDGWSYRKATWEIGPILIPSRTEDDWRIHSLVEVLDLIETHSSSTGREVEGRWRAWKLAHLDVFPGGDTLPAGAYTDESGRFTKLGERHGLGKSGTRAWYAEPVEFTWPKNNNEAQR